MAGPYDARVANPARPPMDSHAIARLADPAILFFFLGILAGALRSNLEVPAPIARFLSLYLLMALGFKGGASLAQSGFTAPMAAALAIAGFMALAVPTWSYAVLRWRLGPYDAAAIAATYGSVSAVTFITAVNFLERQGAAPGGYMAAALVVMESPAIIMAVVLANLARRKSDAGAAGVGIGRMLHEAFTDGAQVLLLGSLVIGFVSGESGKATLEPFLGQMQKGMLAFFLLDMGLLVATRARGLRAHGAFLGAFGILAPLFNALVCALLARMAGIGAPDAFLLVVLAASASYIVVPAVVRYAIPEANAGLYFGMALVVTFPFNIVFGLPLYYTGIAAFWR